MAQKQVEKTAVASYDWGNYQGPSGLEDLSTKDLGIPILNIIQKGSAEFDEDHEDHATKKIEGCKVGDVFNSVTREILHQASGAPLKVIPYFYKLVYLEWRDKSAGGGIVATHTDERILAQTKRDEKNRDLLPNGNYVTTTAYFMVRLENGQDALMTLSSTQLKKARVWLNMMKNFRDASGNTLPMFHRPYLLSTIGESNDKGTWRGWKIEAGSSPITDPAIIEPLLKAVREAANPTALLGNSPSDVDIV